MFTPFEIKVLLKIAKKSAEVFEAISDPMQMCNYFIATSTGRMTTGATLTWTFPEFDTPFLIKVGAVTPNEHINYSWEHPDGSWTQVDILMKPIGDKETLVTITEGKKEGTEANLPWLKSNTEGWSNFLCCLKAWLEYGINLRKGAFDLSQMPVNDSPKS